MTEILVGNTPIFDQLIRDMRDRGVRYENLIAKPVPVTTPTHLKGVRPLYEILDEVSVVSPLPAAVSSIPDDQEPIRVVNVKPYLEISNEIMSQGSTPENMFDGFVEETYAMIRAIHPDAIVEGMELRTEVDGSATMVMKGYAPKTSIGEDVSEGLYMTVPAWRGDEE